MSKEQKKYKKITAVIRVLDAKTDEIDSEIKKIIDDEDRRQWLKETVAKTMMWALLNGKYVEISNEEDEKG